MLWWSFENGRFAADAPRVDWSQVTYVWPCTKDQLLDQLLHLPDSLAYRNRSVFPRHRVLAPDPRRMGRITLCWAAHRRIHTQFRPLGHLPATPYGCLPRSAAGRQQHQPILVQD
jgi:hypothetical protein